MKNRSNQSGEINILLIPVIVVTILFIGAATFGAWAFSEREDYKKNSDKKVAAAVDVARKEEGIEKDKAFAEAAKLPLTIYTGPGEYGGIEVSYPKTWSVYVASTPSQPLNAYFHPSTVPSVGDQNAVYALRVQVLEQDYASIVKTMSNGVKTGKVTAAPYALPQVPGEIGTRFDGLIIANKKSTGSMIVLPLRDKTIEIWTESPEFAADFTKNILPNLSFSP